MEKLNVRQSYYLGVDVGATKVSIGAFLTNGKLLSMEVYPTLRATKDEAVACLLFATEHFLNKHKDLGRLIIIGVGIRGYVDSERGIWVHSSIIPGFQPVKLAALFCEQFHVPTIIDNDVHAATLAELYFGVGRKYRDFIYVNVGSGIAAGLICNGKLVRGCSNFAGEFGYHRVFCDDSTDISKYEGCIEDEISGLGVVNQIKHLLPEYPKSCLRNCEGTMTGQTVMKAYEQRDPLAEAVISRGILHLTVALHNLIGLLNPSAIVLSGGIIRCNRFFEAVKDSVERNRLSIPAMELKEFCRSSSDPEEVGARGAACVAMDWHYRQ